MISEEHATSPPSSKKQQRPLGFLAKLACFSSPRKRQARRARRAVERVEKARLLELFKMVDVDGSGCIDKDELRYLLHKCTGSLPTDAEVTTMMRDVDSNNDGRVDFDEFAAIHARARRGDLPFAALSKILVEFDDLSRSVADDPFDLLKRDDKPKPAANPVIEEAIPPEDEPPRPETDQLDQDSADEAEPATWGSMRPEDEAEEEEDDEDDGPSSPLPPPPSSDVVETRLDDDASTSSHLDDEDILTPSPRPPAEGFDDVDASGDHWRHHDDDIVEDTVVAF